jgi:hypothetical protein
MWEKVFEFASRITGPYQFAAFVSALLVYAFRHPLKSKNPRFALLLLAIALSMIGMFALSLTAYLKSRGIYHIRVVVLGPGGQPADQADVTSSAGGELKQASGNWEFDLPPQAKPSSGQIEFYASVKDAYLAGNSSQVLKEDYFPTVTVQLLPLPSATIRGTVVDENGKSVSGARVAVSGYSDIATTDEMGNFSLPAHHAEGQLVSVRAEKGDRVAEKLTIAGQNAQLTLRKH